MDLGIGFVHLWKIVLGFPGGEVSVSDWVGGRGRFPAPEQF